MAIAFLIQKSISVNIVMCMCHYSHGCTSIMTVYYGKNRQLSQIASFKCCLGVDIATKYCLRTRDFFIFHHGSDENLSQNQDTISCHFDLVTYISHNSEVGWSQ